MPESLHFGRFEVRAAARQLLVEGRPVALGARAFDLLLALIERRDRVVRKDELLDLVWPGLVVEENNLQVQVSGLRKLLGPNAISTIPGRGYRFVAALEAGSEREPEDGSDTDRPHGGPGNLPLNRTALIGRDAELASLLALLDERSLLTLVGAGGIGKTTLALAAARAAQRRFRDGAWLVDLADVTDPTLVPQTISQTLRLALGGQGSARDRLLDVLGSQSMLLLLDNCEGLVYAVGELAANIVARAPGVKVLITSQALLNVPGEQVFRLDPLATPAVDEAPSADRHGAIGLFVERVQAADRRFALTAQNADAVAEICRRLDGLPLAVELAAARVRLLGVQGVLERLGERFRVLAGGARTALPRHQALHATLDWSHGLLSPPEQVVMRRLGVFAGGFSLPLAQQLAGDDSLDEWAVVEALGSLVDRSLVAVDAGEPVRYRLLETTRAYAAERLDEHGETARLRRRHAQVVCDFFVRADEARFGEQGTLSMAQYMDRTVPELDNLRAALDWALSEPGERALAITLAGAGAEVLRQLGLSQEALQRMLSLWPPADGDAPAESIALYCARLGSLGNNGRLPDNVVRAAEGRADDIYRQRSRGRRLYFSLYGRSWSLNLFGEPDAAERLLAEMQTLEQPLWPGWLRACRLNVQASVLLFQHRFDEALAVALEQQRLLAGAAGEESLLTTCQSNLCLILICLHRFDDAIATARSVIDRNAVRRDRNVDYATHHQMVAQLLLGRVDDAEQTMRQAFSGWRRDGLLLYACFGLALLLAARGRLADAARVEALAMEFYRRTGVRRTPVAERIQARLRELFDAAAIEPAVLNRWPKEGGALDEAALQALYLPVEAGSRAGDAP